MIHFFTIVLLIFAQNLNALIPSPKDTIAAEWEDHQPTIFDPDQYSCYACPSQVDQGVWNNLIPYLLPSNHPIKAKLDKIFSESRATLNSDALTAAGFTEPTPRPYSHTIVTGHPDIKGYLIKLYTDEQPDVVDWDELIKRIQGAHYTREAIAKHKFESMFTVPRKWIYPLPDNPAPPPGYHQKHFVLVVEKVRILEKYANYDQWSGATMTPKRLNAIYTILQEVGLDDSMYAFNLPFTKFGKQAFIDTARFHRWPIPFEKSNQYLSPKMKKYWKQLTKQVEAPKQG